MSDNFIICDNCGTKCNVGDTFCKVCFQSLAGSDHLGNQAIDGIENAELEKFIGKNADYYIKKFAGNKDKLFVQLNVAALLFGPTWFFYRKMRKFAAMYAAVLILLSSLLSLALPMVFKTDVEEYYVAREAYINYINDTNSNIEFDEWRNTISDYAVAKDNSGNYIYDETIAEGFHDYYLNGDNAKEASKYIIKVLKKHLKGEVE